MRVINIKLNRELHHLLFRISFILLFITSLPHLQAQQAILSASSEATGNAGTVSYSVGQVAFHLNAGSEGFIIEGVQQPFELQFHEGIEESDESLPDYILYPNPAGSYINLKIERTEIKILSYQIYNMNGFLLQTMETENREVRIPLENLASASYVLTISGNNRVLGSFIIIKK